jgi:hypothetical protein
MRAASARSAMVVSALPTAPEPQRERHRLPAGQQDGEQYRRTQDQPGQGDLDWREAAVCELDS